jgi:hypothetical protein
MIGKNIEEITEEDLQSLVENEVLESRTIEYKSALNIGRDKDKREFLADVSSFTNASGGDLIFGIKEDGGIPKEVEGISIDSLDDLKGKIEDLIRNGIEPKMPPVQFKDIKLSNSNIVLILRIPKSWRSPHRVILKKDYRFFSRNSHGKQFLDVEEIRLAFNFSETFTDRIKKFREDRISNLMAGESPVSLEEGAKFLLHLIPINSFNIGQNYEIESIISDINRLKPIYGMPANRRYNIDGFLVYDLIDEKTDSYVQIYRNGIIEACVTSLINNPEKLLTRSFHEKQLIQSLNSYLNIYNELNVELPVFIFLTVLGVKGFAMSPHSRSIPIRLNPPNVIDRDVLLLPELLIEDYEVKASKILKPCFDSVWNACGQSKSPNYDENGEWCPEN